LQAFFQILSPTITMATSSMASWDIIGSREGGAFALDLALND
jgi:hypothetical protein